MAADESDNSVEMNQEMEWDSCQLVSQSHEYVDK